MKNLDIHYLDVVIAAPDVRVAEAVLKATASHARIGDLAGRVRPGQSLGRDLQGIGFLTQALPDGGLRLVGFEPRPTIQYSDAIWTERAFGALEPIAQYMTGELLYTHFAEGRSPYDGTRTYRHITFGPKGRTASLTDVQYSKLMHKLGVAPKR